MFKVAVAEVVDTATEALAAMPVPTMTSAVRAAPVGATATAAVAAVIVPANGAQKLTTPLTGVEAIVRTPPISSVTTAGARIAVDIFSPMLRGCINSSMLNTFVVLQKPVMCNT